MLFFALMTLVMVESTSALRSATRFRARVRAEILAENAAELAARNMVSAPGSDATLQNDDGTMHGSYRRLAENRFEITGTGDAAGPMKVSARVRLFGTVEGSTIRLDRTIHGR